MAPTELHNAQPAGFVRRLMAGIYDWLLVIAVMMVASVPVVAITGAEIAPGNPWYRLALCVIAAVFFIGFWSRGGQTLGMRAWRITLTTAEGREPNVTQAILRFGLAILSAAALGIGFLWVLVSKEKLSWHDKGSATRVLHSPKRN